MQGDRSFSLSLSSPRLPHRIILTCIADTILFGLVLVVFLSQSTEATEMLRTPPAFAVRIVSYNVLSSHLASPAHFSTLDPDHLKASNRLPLVLNKLEEAIGGNNPNVVVCLQEVSYDWAGAFHVWFANRGYHLVTGLYGKRFNGYMGVALAYPTAAFETVDIDISRLSDKRMEGWPKEPDETLTTQVYGVLQSLWKKPMQKLGLAPAPPHDHWKTSSTRFNVLLTATLRDKASGETFCVGNYHMPCAYYAPMVMSIHAELAARHVQNLANTNEGGDGIPYVIAGDWNITPDSPTYKLMTTGRLDKDDASYPTPKYGMEWNPEMQPMRSAYAESTNGEPDFTNYARVKEDDPFIDTLDYIFLSGHWKVDEVKTIENRKDVNGPFPNAVEPSDHILISANLELDKSMLSKV